MRNNKRNIINTLKAQTSIISRKSEETDQRPPTIQQGTAEGTKRINTKLASTLLLPHCLCFPFEKSKKSLCHSHFTARRNAIIQ